MEWRIKDAAFGQDGPSQADIWIQSVDDEDDIFGMLEVRSSNIITGRYLKVFDPSVSFNTPPQRFRVSIEIKSKIEVKCSELFSTLVHLRGSATSRRKLEQ